MGSPLSSIITDLVLCYLEERVLDSLDIILPFYFKYVGDIATAVSFEKNSWHF